MVNSVSGEKVNHFIHFHNSGKQCRILTKFYINNASKAPNLSKICQRLQKL